MRKRNNLGTLLPVEFFSSSPEETVVFGMQFGKKLPQNCVIAFYGDLAAGKTTLIKGIVAGYTGLSLDEVSSPTYSYLHIYSGSSESPIAYHFDLYRLHGSDEFFSMGFDEFFFKKGLCLIEWAERIEEVLQEQSLYDINIIKIELQNIKLDCRKISIK